MMNLWHAGIKWAGIATGLVVVATGAGLLAGCHSRTLTEPQLTGNQGGLMPGMIAHDWQQPDDPGMARKKVVPQADGATPSNTPPGYTGVIQQVQPDGHHVAREYLNGQLLSQTWISSLGLPEHAVYYINGSQVGGEYEFGPDGKLTKRTYYYVGSKQPVRIEEIADGQKMTRFTTYWPNGNLHIVSEANVPTPDGVVNRVQEWYASGKPKSLAQIHLKFDAQGREIDEEKQGRQTAWDENGYVISDLEFDQNRAIYDYISKKKISSQ